MRAGAPLAGSVVRTQPSSSVTLSAECCLSITNGPITTRSLVKDMRLAASA